MRRVLQLCTGIPIDILVGSYFVDFFFVDSYKRMSGQEKEFNFDKFAQSFMPGILEGD